MSQLARRRFLAAVGGLGVVFRFPIVANAQDAALAPGTETSVDAWLRVGPDGRVTIKFGKVELGTGIATAIAQIVADELDVPVANVHATDADTADTPDQGVTAGSASLSTGAIPVRKAAAELRSLLVTRAAEILGVDASDVVIEDGRAFVPWTPSKKLSIGRIAAGKPTGRMIGPTSGAVKSPSKYRVVGTSLPRVDLAAKVYGRFSFMQDVRLPEMLHARVVRPPRVGASLIAVDDSAAAAVTGYERFVRQGNFLAVVAHSEWGAIAAADALRATWTGGGIRPAADLAGAVRATPVVSSTTVLKSGSSDASTPASLATSYVWPYQSHGSIGPSCAIADVRADRAEIWSSTQGVFPLRDALAQLLGLPKSAVRVRYAEGAGCYGHNGSDDAAADAALISQAIGRPVRVQWSRADEHAWDPKTPATFTTLNAILDRASGRIRSWNAEIWSPSHSTRPSGEAGNLLAGQLTDVTPAKITFVGGDRNARTNYDVPNQQVTMHNLRAGILRASAMRGLGGTANTFANESFIDELAALAGADPIAFRRAHLSDPRALAVIDAVATLSNWTPRAAGSQRHSGGIARGRGMAFVRYENVHAYVATVADIAVNLTTGVIRVERISVAHDCGLIINPDGLRNQLEGNAIQATSRALNEAVEFDGERVKSVDWKTYPILRFSEVPQVALTLINRPTEPVLGAGEASTTTVAPAIANALFDATGVRVRTIPLTPTRVLAALQSAQVNA